MIKIAFLNQKGGVGKSTLAINIGSFFAQNKKKVLVIDSDDPQYTVNHWYARNNQKRAFEVKVLGDHKLSIMINNLSEDYDFVFIDLPGALNDLVAEAIKEVNLVIVPLQASLADLESTMQLLHWVSKAKFAMAMEHKIPVEEVLLFNRLSPRAIINKRSRKTIEGLGFPVLRYSISERKIFRDSYERGVSIFESEPSDEAAEQEIISVCHELREKYL